MGTNLIGTSATAEEVLAALKIDTRWVHEEHLRKLGGHDFSDPFAATEIPISGGRISLTGNRASNNKTVNLAFGTIASVHVRKNGTIEEPCPIAIEPWIASFEANGWKAREGLSPIDQIYAQKETVISHWNERIVYLRSVSSSSSSGHLIAKFATFAPNGELEPKTLIIRHQAEGPESAAKIIEKIKTRESLALPEEESARKHSADIVAKYIQKLSDNAGVDVEWTGKFSSWHLGVAEIETYDRMLHQVTMPITVQLRSEIAQTGLVEIEDESRRQLERAVHTLARRHKARINAGQRIGSLARAIMKNRKPEQCTGWHTTISRDFISRSRVNIRDGRVSGELVVEKEKAQILRITANKFELPNVEAPQTILSKMPGRALREFIDHPYLSEKLIITSARRSKTGIEGRYRDNGEETHEAP